MSQLVLTASTYFVHCCEYYFVLRIISEHLDREIRTYINPKRSDVDVDVPIFDGEAICQIMFVLLAIVTEGNNSSKCNFLNLK